MAIVLPVCNHKVYGEVMLKQLLLERPSEIKLVWKEMNPSLEVFLFLQQARLENVRDLSQISPQNAKSAQ